VNNLKCFGLFRVILKLLQTSVMCSFVSGGHCRAVTYLTALATILLRSGKKQGQEE